MQVLTNVLNLIVRLLGGPSMVKFLIRRILAAVPVLFVVTFVTFFVMRAMPGGPFDAVGTKSTSPVVRAALEARYGLDKPFFLNLPNDGASPDFGMESRTVFPPGPLCEGLRAGQTRKEATPKEAVYVYDGWALLRFVEEYYPTTISYKDPSSTDDAKPTRCVDKRTVLYSDLTRSQFFNYVNNALRLDFGLSIGRNSRDQPVWDIISDALPVSMQLGLLAVGLGFVLGVPLGVIAALKRNTPIDYGITIMIGAFVSVPSLVLGPLLITYLTGNGPLGVFPSPDPRVWKGGSVLDWEYMGRAILPMMALGLGIAAGLARLTKASVLQVLRDDYIRTARAKGLRERSVVFIHALKNALIPVVTIIGPLLAGILTGTLVIERVFSIPGLGGSFISSITNRDYNLLVGVTILFSIFLIIGNILVDVMYTWLDPRIRFD
jgi:oligopeptide transport system permease protein